MSQLSVIGFDADDTLWECESFFRFTEERFTELLADFADPDHLQERLLAAERKNIEHYGYGIKGFTLSMVETSIEVTEGRVPAHVIGQILDAGREMHAHPIHLRPHAEETLASVKENHRIALITKGDLIDQERKIAQSGLGEMFDIVEIVSEKNEATYRDIFARTGGAERAMMVGNSIKSDVIPALLAGSWGVHVPHGLIWALDHADDPDDQPRFRQVDDLSHLPTLIEAIQ